MSSNMRRASHRKNVASVDMVGEFKSVNLMDNGQNDFFENYDAQIIRRPRKFELERVSEDKRDKADDIFDHENSSEEQEKTAGQELDAAFTERQYDDQKCFSFSTKKGEGDGAGGQQLNSQQSWLNQDFGGRHSSIKSAQLGGNVVMRASTIKYAGAAGDSAHDLDDSLNNRVSNPSESSHRQHMQKVVNLFQEVPAREEEDHSSGHFMIHGSGSSGKTDNRPSTGGFKKASTSSAIKSPPNYGYGNDENDQTLQQIRSPNTKVIQQKLVQKEVRPTQFFRPSGFNEVDDREDNFDDEASPVKPAPERRQLMEKLDNSLDNSNIQMEGEIGSSPQKIYKAHHPDQSKASNEFLQNQMKKRDMAQEDDEDAVEGDSLFERQQNNYTTEQEHPMQNTQALPQNTMPPNKPVGVQRRITSKINTITKVTSPSRAQQLQMQQQIRHQQEQMENGKLMNKSNQVTAKQQIAKMGNKASFKSPLVVRNQQISYNSQSPINSLSTHMRFATAQKLQFPRKKQIEAEFASVPLEVKQVNRNGVQVQAKEAYGKDKERAVHVRRNSSIKAKAKKMVQDAKQSAQPQFNNLSFNAIQTQPVGHHVKLRLKSRVPATENPSLKSGSINGASESKSDNESATNNIKSFTQNASINESNRRTTEKKVAQNALKSKGRPRVDSGRLGGAQCSGTTGSHNDVHRITRFKELFAILGIQSFDDTEHTFEYGEQAYRLDLSEMLKDLTVVRIKKQQPVKAPNSQRVTSQREVTQMAIDPKDQVELEDQQLNTAANSGQGFASKTGRLQQDPQSLNFDAPHRQLGVSQPYHTSSQTPEHRTKTPTHQSIGFQSASGTPRIPGMGSYATVSKSPNHLQNTLSQSNIMSPISHPNLPPSKAGYTTNQLGGQQAMQQNLVKNLNKQYYGRSDNRMELLNTNNLNTDSALAKSSRSGVSGPSAATSGGPTNGFKELKSSIVSSHEQNAMRHRSRSKQGSRNSYRNNSRSGNTTCRDGIYSNMNTKLLQKTPSQMSVGGLQIKRQTQTSTPGFINESMHQFGKLESTNQKFKVHGSQEQLSIQQYNQRQQHIQSHGQQPNIQQQQIVFASGQHGSGTMSSLNPSQYLSNHDVQGLLQPEIMHSNNTINNMLGKAKFPSSDSKAAPDRAYTNPPYADAEHESSNQYLMSHEQEEPVACCCEEGHGQHSQHQLSSAPQVHLAFLFASPLMLKTSDQKFYDVLPPISFSEEFEQIKESIEEKNIEFNYRYSVANQKNILTALRENPVGLHFSGHGFQNNEKLFQGDKKGWLKYKNKGDVLIFENESGASEFFFTTELKKMFEDIQSSKKGTQVTDADADKAETVKTTDLQFVYVASCHSEQVGRIFLEAGVPHVICIDQNETILDKAAIEFSKFFYDEVFDTFKNICDAYTYAKEKVEKAYGKFQADKIMLLKNEKIHGKVCSEQKDERLNLQKGVVNGLQRIGIECDNILPNKVSPFISRNQDMFDVLRLLSQDNNIVQIYGMPGLGKSSLLKNVTCFLGDRDIYKDGVLYIDFLHVQTFKESLQILNAYLKDDDDDQQDYFYQSFNDNQDEFQHEIEKVKGKIMRFTKKFLFSLDNIDHLVKDNHEQFLTFILGIASPHVKVLFTSNKFSVKEFGEGFSVKKIQKLKKADSVELFLKKIPLGDQDKKSFLEYGNIVELHKVTLAKYGDDGDVKSRLPTLCGQRHTHSNLCIVNYLSKHPIFDFFAGIPLVISIVAPLSVFKSLSEIFQYLAAKNEGNFQEDLKHKMADESLIHCLEYCSGYFENKKGSHLLELWYLIGTQGPGILYEDLKEILGESGAEAQTDQKKQEAEVDEALLDDVKKDEAKEEENEQNDSSPPKNESQLDRNLRDLIQFSLVEQENLDKAGTARRYRVSPFVDQYINTKMSNAMKRDQLNLVCMHLKTKLIELKKGFAKEVVECKTQEEMGQVEATLQEKIRPYEQQIMHIVCTVIKLTKDEDDRDSLVDAEEADQVALEGTDSKSQINASSDQQPQNPSNSQHLAHEQSMMSLSTIKSGNTNGRARSKHNRNPSRDAPQVSDVVKYQRSTINLGKSPHAGLSVSQMLEEFKQPAQQQRDRLETVVDSKRTKQQSSKSPRMNKTLTLNNQRRQYAAAGHADQAGFLSPDVDDGMFDRIEEIQMEQMQSKAQTEHVAGGKEKNSSLYSRPQGARLGFVHAKHKYGPEVAAYTEQSKIQEQNFLADRERAMGLSENQDNEKQGSSNSSQDAKAKQQPSNQGNMFDTETSMQRPRISQLEIQDLRHNEPVTPALADLWSERDAEYARLAKEESEAKAATDAAKGELKLPEDANSRNELQLTNQKSSGPFENVSALELAKLFNKQIGQDGDCDIGHLEYDEAKRKSDEQLELPDFRSRKQRQSLLLKGLAQHKYDETSTMFSAIRTSILQKSISQDKSGCLQQLSSFKHNPDIVGAFAAAAGSTNLANAESTPAGGERDWTTGALAPVLENSRSAPAKTTEAAADSSATLLHLAPHEELLFHYLAILAVIPNKRNHILHILDFYGQRDNTANEQQQQKSGAQPSFDLVGQAEKHLRLKRFQTMVDIPQNAELLQANTKMIELYVLIVQEGVFSITGVNPLQAKHIKYDRIYEEADSTKAIFEEIQFTRGLAIIDYIQAVRQLEKFKKKDLFKSLLEKSARGFEQAHELDGIQQCLVQARRLLDKKYSQFEDEKETKKFISSIEQIYEDLNSHEDEQVQNFKKFRSNIKIPNLHQKLIVQQGSETGGQTIIKLESDLVYNMLLNPQYFHTKKHYHLRGGKVLSCESDDEAGGENSI